VGDDEEIVTADGVSREGIAPLARAVQAELNPPFCAIAVHDEGDVWSAAANIAHVIELPVKGSELVVTRIGQKITTTLDGEEVADPSVPPLEKLLDSDGTVMAHRFVNSTWVAEAFPL